MFRKKVLPCRLASQRSDSPAVKQEIPREGEGGALAILNGIEGSAHVQVAGDGVNWIGYILVEIDPGNLLFFDTEGPRAKVIYEGPVLASGTYHFANGKTRVTAIHYTPDEFRIFFKGIEQLNFVRPLPGKPEDYLP